MKYELQSVGNSLILSRHLCRDGKNKKASFSNMRKADVITTDVDKKIEVLLQGRFNSPPSKSVLRSVFAVLEEDGHSTIPLNGVDTDISSEILLPIGIVEDKGEGFNVCIRRHPEITDVFTNAVICSRRLRITSRGNLSDIQFKRLASGIEYNLDDVEYLVCQVVPSLEEKIEVQLKTDRLPPAISVKPIS